MTPFQELEAVIDKYLLLEDRYIVRLLCAAVIANRIPELEPTWLFIISNTSGGKSELLTAMSYARGCWEQDDLSTKTFISGASKGGTETSLLYRLPKKDPIIVFKDLTLLLDKDPRESGEIFSQLRLIYDGKLNKSFGTGEDIKVKIRLGLIAGTTTAIEDIGAKQASMGQRAIRYVMTQPDRKAVTRKILKSKNPGEMKTAMGEAFKHYLDLKVNMEVQTPDLPDDTLENIVDISEMATKARSSIKRDEYSREKRVTRNDPPEMPGRMAKQLKALGQAMMIMNQGPLEPRDAKILYKVALDSIPSGRKDVMVAATKYARVELDALALDLKLHPESVKLHLYDLIALGIMVMEKKHTGKFQYYLQDDYRALIAKFENIEMTNEVMKEVEEKPEEAPAMSQEEEQSLKQLGFI